MNRVLFVSHYFPPSSASGAFRMLGLAKYLPACGWDVTVIAPHRAPFEPVDMSLCQRVPESVRQVRFPYQPSRFSLRLGALLGRLQVVDRHCIALPAFVNAMIACVRREQPDVILTSGPPHSTHIAGWLARRLFGIPWVMDLRDPWLLGRSIRTEWVRRCYGAANAVISNTQTAKHATVERYPECTPKSVVITNGYDPDLFTGSTPSSDGRIIFSYVGNFYGRRTPEPLLRAVVNVLQRRPELRSLLQVNFAGRWDGRTVREQRRLFQGLGLAESVRLLGQIDHTAAVGLMRKSDVLILVQGGARSMSIPAKTYEYLAARRTILCLAPPGGELVTRLQRTGARVHVAPSGSAAAIQDALLTVVSQLETKSADAQKHRVAIKEYSQPHLAKQLAGLLFQVIERNHVFQKNEGRPPAGASNLGAGERANMESAIDVSFLIVNYNMAGLVRHSVNHLVDHLKLSNLDFEILVADNSTGPADALDDEFAQHRPEVTLTRARPAGGWIPALNALIPQARGEVVCIMHPDVELGPECAQLCVDYLQTHPEVGVVAPNPYQSDGQLAGCPREFPTLAGDLKKVLNLLTYLACRRKPFGDGRVWDHTADASVASVLSFCFFCRASLLREIWPINAGLGSYFGNDYVCMCAHELGLDVRYLEEPYFFHYERRTPRGLYSRSGPMQYKTSAVMGSPGMHGDRLRFIQQFYPWPTALAFRLLTALEFSVHSLAALLKGGLRNNGSLSAYVQVLLTALSLERRASSEVLLDDDRG